VRPAVRRRISRCPDVIHPRAQPARQRAGSAPPPYGESFIIEEGTARFTLGEHELEVTGGHIVVVPAGVRDGFVNVGPPPMRSINVHPVARMQTEWLD
jgi:quercetin dioxygenase-like cupin family protein